jgi:hypothetical protein
MSDNGSSHKKLTMSFQKLHSCKTATTIYTLSPFGARLVITISHNILCVIVGSWPIQSDFINEEARHIEETQWLVTEIQMLKIVLYLVNRNKNRE